MKLCWYTQAETVLTFFLTTTIAESHAVDEYRVGFWIC